jgi:hypothetical protein
VHGCFDFYMRIMCTIIWLMTSVWPSIFIWEAVDLVSLVPIIDQRLDQNILRNLLSRSEMIYYGIPKFTHTRSKKILAVAFAVIFFLQTIIMDIFKNLFNDHKKTVIAMLSRRKARHVIHGDGFPRLTRSRKQSIEALLLDG